MRVWILVYGVLYVVIELIRHEFDRVGWPQVTALDVASAAVDALLAIAVCGAVLLGIDLGRKRWGRSVRAWWQAQQRPANLPDERPIGVRSWRPESEPRPVAAIGGSPADRSPSARPPASRTDGAGTYAPGTSRGPRFPEDPGYLL